MLTLEEIENISFRRAGIGGYKTDDVDNFVDGVIVKVKNLQSANKELESRIEQLNAQIQMFKERQESVQDAIITAEMTSKSVIKEATRKAEVLVADANSKAENIINEANIQSEQTVSEAKEKADNVISNAVRESAFKVNQNNQILEKQKILMIEIQEEIKRFKKLLVKSYKSHLEMINSIPDADTLNEYQDKLDEYYAEETNADNIFNTAVVEEKEISVDEIKETEPVCESTTEKTISSETDTTNIAEEKNNTEDNGVVFSSGKNNQDNKTENSIRKIENDNGNDSEAEDMPVISLPENNREPVILDSQTDKKFGVLKLDDEQE